TLLCRMSIRPSGRPRSASPWRALPRGSRRPRTRPFTALLPGKRGGLLGRGEIAVDSENAGAFLRETQHRGPAVSDAFARALSGADDDRNLPFEANGKLPEMLFLEGPQDASS